MSKPPTTARKPYIDPEELQIHRLYRERVVQEDQLINHRMSWMLWSSAIILAVWAAVAQKFLGSGDKAALAIFTILSICGALSAVGSAFAVKAAHDEISELRSQYLCLYPRKNDNLPGLTGSKHFHRMGHIVPDYMPIMLIFLWVSLILVPFVETLR